MPGQEKLASRIYLKLDGVEVEEEQMAALLELVVDQHSHLPDMFTIRFGDSDLALLDNGPFDLTREVEIEAADEEGQKFTLVRGEITALEPSFEEGMIAELVVRGYDRSHRLYRETKSRAFVNVKDSDLAEQVARAAGLQAEVQATSTVYDHIYQHNQSDLAFLMQRAWRIGYECFVENDTLHFRRPPSGGEGVTLVWGEDLLSFEPRMTLAEQVDEVLVKGWNENSQEPIVGRAGNGALYPQLGEEKNGAEWAAAFGAGRHVIVDQPVVSQAEADVLAAARLNELSGAFVQAHGVAFRRPDLKAGRNVTLEALGSRFSGAYLVTNVRHVYTPEGLQSRFTVRGSRTGLLAEQLAQQPPLDRRAGLVPAVVTNSDDPQQQGRVKVKFPWLSEEAESNWARVISAGAGPQAGFYAIPEVGDEVIVAFEHGDFNRPYVLGGVWNGRNEQPVRPAGGEQPLVRSWQSRSGHRITMHDNVEDKIEIESADGHSITLDDAGGNIQIESASGLIITLDNNGRKITLESNGEVEVKAQGNMKLQAGANLNLEASGQVNVRGATINLN